VPDSLAFSSGGFIRLSAGSYVGTGAYTFAMVCKKTGSFGGEEFLFANDNSTWLWEMTTNNPGQLAAYDGTSLRSSATAAFDLDGWQLMAVCKAAGTDTPRLHTYTWDTTSWVHVDAGGTVGNNGAVNANGMRISGSADGFQFTGNILICALWDSELSDGTIETLITGKPAWSTANPKEAWRLDSAATTTLTPFVGTSAEQSRGGTVSLDVGDAPSGWSDSALLMTDSTPEISIGNATESIRTATTDPYTFTHTPTGTPKGIVLCAVHGVSATDHISGVTYGGVAMSRVVRATDTVTEPGAAEIWFLGAGIPTGAQTVSIDLTSATTDDFQFVCITLLTNDGGDTEVVDSDGVSENVANPSVTLQYNGRVAAAVGVLYGGGADGSVFTPNANCSTIEDHDLGNFYAEVIKQTTPGNADFTIGGTSGTDDVAFVAAAFANAHRSRPAATNFQDPG
jgi:hypothetical protein